jgi:hypothetical protein
MNVYLNDTPSLVQGYAPLTLTFIPSGFSVTNGAVVKIEYNFGDGSDPVTVKRKLYVDTATASAYPYQSDLGDPRNVEVTHTFYPLISQDPTDFYVTVNVTRSNSFIPFQYVVPVSVLKVSALSGLDEGYFSNIRLVKTRSWGTENNKLLIFETEGPRYLTCMMFSDNQISPSSMPPIVPTVTPTVTPTPTPTPTETTTPTPTPTPSGEPILTVYRYYNYETTEILPDDPINTSTDIGTWTSFNLELYNTGTQPLNVTSIFLSNESDPDEWSMDVTPAEVAPGGWIQAVIYWNPVSTPTFDVSTATLNIVSNDANSPRTVVLNVQYGVPT